MIKLHKIIFIILLSITNLYSTGNLSKEEIRELYKKATRFFDEANELSKRNPDNANELYKKSILHFDKIIREGKINNGKLYYNIGNAYFKIGDIGRAILYYRKALNYRPNDPNIIQNLNYARSRRVDVIEETEQTKILKILFFWHYDIPVKIRAYIFSISFIILWTTLSILLFHKNIYLNIIFYTSLVLSIMFFTSLFVDNIYHSTNKYGVVIAQEVIARKGDSDIYEPSFQEPIHAGLEFILLESRKNWYYIQLENGKRCWVQSNTVELIE